MSYPSDYSQVPYSGPGNEHVSLTQRMFRAFMERRRVKYYPPRNESSNGVGFTTEQCFTVTAPCMRSGFSFEVSVVSTWSARGYSEPVEWAMEQAESEHHENIERKIRALVRDFDPDAFAAAEARINEELALRVPYEAGMLTCRSWARVGPDEALRRHLQKLWTNQSDDEAQQVRAKRHIEHIAELRELWEEFLRELDGSTAVPAVRLAGNPRIVGEVASEVVKAKQGAIQELRQIVDQATGAHENHDLYKYAMSYDSALNKLIRYLDISASSDSATGPEAA